MEEENKQAQDDELMALSSIYDADVFTVNDEEGSNPGGSYTCILDLPQPFEIVISDVNSTLNKFKVHYLPEITLHFVLPSTYPASQSPTFSLVCKWLKHSQLTQLCTKLDEIWDENKGEVILFLWTNFLQNDLLDYLDISCPLDLSNTVPCKTSSSADSEGAHSADPRAIQDILSQDMLLPAILDFNTKQSELKFSTELFTCNVCFSEKFGKQCLQFMQCQHVFCKDCLKSFFEIQIKDGNVQSLLCPEDGCDSAATQGQVRDVVDEALFHRYDRLLLQSSLDTMSDIMYCPRKSCGNPVILDQESSMGSCAACQHVFCIYCKLTYHGVSPCKIKSEEMKALRDAYEASTGEERRKLERRYGKHVLRQLIEDSFSEEWLRTNSKQCPHCSTHIEKVDGCNKMTCTKCRTFFCWLCGAHLAKNNPYGHFNTPGGGCFNQLFQGVDVDAWEDEVENAYWR